MFKRQPVPALALSIFVFTTLCLLASAVTAQTETPADRASTNFIRASDNALAAAKEELLDAARAHHVKIQVDRMMYNSEGRMTIVNAPIMGTEKYKSADFATGAPILLMIVKSTMKLSMPNGSYVVNAQYQSGATSGKVTFTDRNGAISAQRDLIVRTRKQWAMLFPKEYSDTPSVDIPNITSVHCFVDVLGVTHCYYDCSGVNGTLYFEMG
jgi:hypothetical protein